MASHLQLLLHGGVVPRVPGRRRPERRAVRRRQGKLW